MSIGAPFGHVIPLSDKHPADASSRVKVEMRAHLDELYAGLLERGLPPSVRHCHAVARRALRDAVHNCPS